VNVYKRRLVEQLFARLGREWLSVERRGGTRRAFWSLASSEKSANEIAGTSWRARGVTMMFNVLVDDDIAPENEPV